MSHTRVATTDGRRNRSGLHGFVRLWGTSVRAVGALAVLAAREVVTLVGFLGKGALSGFRGDVVGHEMTSMLGHLDQQRRIASAELQTSLSARDPQPRHLTQHDGLHIPANRPATQRALAWHFANPPLTLAGVAAVVAMMTFSVASFATPFLATRPYGYLMMNYMGNAWTVDARAVAYVFTLGLASAAAVGPLAKLVVGVHAHWTARSLARPDVPTLEQRVVDLTATRRTARELQEAEIRRIERDLHDGAQARIVAMGMTLTQASRLMEIDPAGARQLLETAKVDSSAALQDLRGLVRGIRPPVLADRGLEAAVRSMAASSPIDMRVSADLPGRLVAPLESALYFTVAELVTNAVKHSAATEIVVDLGLEGDWAVARVTDNGLGGVVETSDGGLAGIRSRLAPFDGVLEIASPVGGPTVVTVRVPRPTD